MKKQVFITMAALTLSLGISSTVLAEGWKQNEAGWWYEKEDKTYPVNAWFQDPADGKWYHFDGNGYMQTGWIQDGGKHYYLDKESGAMWANAVTPDGWQLDPSGAWLESAGQKAPADTTTTTTASQKEKAGWREDGVGRWYQNADGSYIKNRWKTINSSRYYFDESGYVTVGFAEIDGDEYYFSDKGVLKTNDFVLEGEVYIVNSKGVIQDVVDEWDYENRSSQEPIDYNDYGDYSYDDSDDNGYTYDDNNYIYDGDSEDDDSYDDSGKNSYPHDDDRSEEKTPQNDSGQNSGQPQEDKENDYYPSYGFEYADVSYGSGSSSNSISDGLNREMAESVIEIVNKERAKVGRASLSMDESLMEACEIRAEELVEKYSHTRPDGTKCFTVLRGIYAYQAVGENIARGQTCPETVMYDWMNSEGHRANILNENYQDIGVGCYIKNGKKHWVQLFGA